MPVRLLTPRDSRVPLASMVGALGVADAVAGLLAPRAAPAIFSPLLSFGGALTVLACALTLLLLARGLARGLRPAWLITVGLLLDAVMIAPAGHIIRPLVVLIIVALLWLRRADFAVHARAAWRSYAAVLAGLLLASIAVTSAHGGHARHMHTAFVDVVRAADVDDRDMSGIDERVMVRREVSVPDVVHVRPGPPLAGVAALVLLAVGLRGLALPGLPGRNDAERRARALARRLFAAHGENGVSYYATLDAATLWADPRGRGTVHFRVVGTTALAAGDPLAAPADLPAVLDGFLAHCHAHGWTPAFYQTLDSTLALYRARGLKALAIGREAIIDLPTFTLAGKRIANVRHSVTHAERAGVRVRLYDERTLDEATRADLAAISDEWLTARGGGEMGFTMGTLTPDGRPTPGARVAVAYGPDGRASAFITLVPSRAGRGWMLDLMRRRADAESGTMDLLIARSAEALRDEGFAVLSLSLAPLASDVGDDEDAPGVVRRARLALYERMGGAYSYRSLYNYKRKFNVRWETRYLMYAGDPHLAAALYATARAHVPARLAAVLPRSRAHVGALLNVWRRRAMSS